MTLTFSFRQVNQKEFAEVAGRAVDELKTYSNGFARLRANFFDENGRLIALMKVVEDQPNEYYIEN